MCILSMNADESAGVISMRAVDLDIPYQPTLPMKCLKVNVSIAAVLVPFEVYFNFTPKRPTTSAGLVRNHGPITYIVK